MTSASRFLTGERDRIHELLLARAEADGAITGAAFTGSHARPTAYAKGAHLLPGSLAAALETALVRALSEAELRRALAAAIDVVSSELRHWNPPLVKRLQPMLAELRGPGTGPRNTGR